MLIPGLEMSKFMDCRDQKGIWIEIMIDRDPVALIPDRVPVIPKTTTSAPCYAKTTLRPHDPLCNQISSLSR